MIRVGRHLVKVYGVTALWKVFHGVYPGNDSLIDLIWGAGVVASR